MNNIIQISDDRPELWEEIESLRKQCEKLAFALKFYTHKGLFKPDSITFNNFIINDYEKTAVNALIDYEKSKV